MAKKQWGRPPAATQRGVFTRSQSEIFLHRTRSGLLRADQRDSRRRCNTFSAQSALSSVESRCGGTGIKDLRLRRVFSPANIAVDSSPHKEDGGQSCEVVMDAVGELMEEKVREENGGVGGVGVEKGLFGSAYGPGDAMQCSQPVHLNDAEADEESMDGAKKWGLCHEQPAAPAAESSYPTSDVGVGEITNESDESKDEQMQCTPTDFRHTTEMEEDNTDRAKMTNLRNERAASMTPMTTETSFPPKSQLCHQDVKPCPRSKLFRNPSSFSYRRLLPFFMDLVKDNSDDMQIIPWQSSPQKVKKPSEDTATLSNSLHEKQLPPRGCTEEELRESLNDDVSKMQESTTKVIDYLISRSPTECSNEEVHEDTVSNNELYNAGELDIVEVKSDAFDDYLDLVPDILCKSSHFASTVSEALSVEELAGNALGISYIPITDERPGRNMVHSSKIEKPLLGASEMLPLYSTQESVLRPKKGILKKQTKGCKGICMCLDCVSFRIHADRAFEFSRKQMLEADEIIEGLVKELAGLRSLAEKSIQPMTESNIFHTNFQFNQELLKAACLRSSRAVEVANKRRREMFNDLNAHCRIPGPRTTFAETIDEAHN